MKEWPEVEFTVFRLGEQWEMFSLLSIKWYWNEESKTNALQINCWKCEFYITIDEDDKSFSFFHNLHESCIGICIILKYVKGKSIVCVCVCRCM